VLFGGGRSTEVLAGPSTSATADLPEAPQTSGRPIIISKITESTYRSPKKERQARRDAYRLPR
jgi:hypothetical protein